MTPNLLKLIQKREEANAQQEVDKARQKREDWTNKVQGLIDFGEDFWATLGMSEILPIAHERAQVVNNGTGFVVEWHDEHGTAVQFYTNQQNGFFAYVRFSSLKWDAHAISESIRRDYKTDHAGAILETWEKYTRAIRAAQMKSAIDWGNEFLEHLAEMDTDDGLLRTQMTNKLAAFVNNRDIPADCKTAPLHKIADKLIDALGVTRSVAREEYARAREYNSEVAQAALERILGVAPDYFRGGDFGGFSPDQIPF